MAVKARGEITLTRVNDGTNGQDGQMLFATSSTAAGTAAKVAALAGGKLTLATGATVAVRFSAANTAASPTLNVAGTGAKPVYTQGVRAAFWSAGAIVIFTYDGANWRVASEPVYASTVTVGNGAGFNVYIDGGNVYVRNGSTVLATYNASQVKLGQNSAGSIISLCGDNLEIGTKNVNGKTIDYIKGASVRISPRHPAESGSASNPHIIVDESGVTINGEKYRSRTWTLLGEVSGEGFRAIWKDVNLYDEFMLTVGPFRTGDTKLMNRILASIVIPRAALLNTINYNDANGAHQAFYNETYWAGLNYVSTNQMQIRASQGVAIARLWAR